MEQLPLYIPSLFIAIVIATIYLLYRSSKSGFLLYSVIAWTVIHGVLGFFGVYNASDSMPPRMLVLGFLPSILAILYLLFSKRGQVIGSEIDLKTLTVLHVVRVFVEVVLFLLYHEGVVSKYMTFEGTNFDILSGISAPVIAILAFRGAGVKSKGLLLTWNFVALALLLNVVITAVFAIPSPIQKLAFDQPNVAVLHFPFNLLPNVVVPVVLYSHLVVIKRLLKK